MVKVGLVGAGTMGAVHAEAYTRMSGVQLVGITDVRADAAAQLAAACGTRAWPNLDQLLEEADPDVVDVCVPTYLHRSLVERIAGAGKHIICEKPIARTLEDARAMMRAADAAGVRLFIAHVLRFFPEYRRARDLIAAGKVGQPGTVRTMRGGVFPRGWDDWYASVDKCGTLIVDMIIHDFDFLRWCFGEVERVFARSCLGRELNRIDHALVSLRFRNGVIGHVEGTWAYPEGFRTELEVAGTAGILHHDSTEATPVHAWYRQGATDGGGVSVPESPLAKGPYQVELEHFIDCIVNGTAPVVTAEDAYRALEISLAALQSATTGQPVSLPMDGGDHA
ncbi:MAG: Gfo/Idh/MocA family oxidoreductase [Alicyclobacillus sp.]|nr:Gfo/Idh/MocA family oxidoreductase [Alicyclobacillus sp.]